MLVPEKAKLVEQGPVRLCNHRSKLGKRIQFFQRSARFSKKDDNKLTFHSLMPIVSGLAAAAAATWERDVRSRVRVS